jgi:predicted DNA-binding transcriptional regulator AlpA
MLNELKTDGPAVIDVRGFMMRVGVSRSTVDRLLRDGLAPPRVQLSTRRFGFRVVDVDQWIADRVR